MFDDQSRIDISESGTIGADASKRITQCYALLHCFDSILAALRDQCMQSNQQSMQNAVFALGMACLTFTDYLALQKRKFR